MYAYHVHKKKTSNCDDNKLLYALWTVSDKECICTEKNGVQMQLNICNEIMFSA